MKNFYLNLFLNEQDELIKLGKRLYEIRIFNEFYNQGDYGRLFNNNKSTTLISRHENGSNIKFATMMRYVYINKMELKSIFPYSGKLSDLRYHGNLPYEERKQEELHKFRKNLRHYKKEKDLIFDEIQNHAIPGGENFAKYMYGEEEPEYLSIIGVALILNVRPWDLFKN